jgi:hypothetical protein
VIKETTTMPITMRQVGPCFAAEVDGVDMTRLGYKIVEHVAMAKATHAVFKKSV